MFIQEMLDHMEAVGRPNGTLCFIDPKCGRWAGGALNRSWLIYRETRGLNVVHADPAELYVRAARSGTKIPRLTWAIAITDARLLYMEKEEGLDIRPMKILFRENRMVSSLAGDFDHKSTWEILTDPRFTEKYFTPMTAATSSAMSCGRGW